MKIEVLGTGCARCNTTEEIVKQAVLDAGIEAENVIFLCFIGARQNL